MSAEISPEVVEELKRIGESVVAMARREGAEHAEVIVRSGAELTAKVRLGKPELVSEAGSRALGIRVQRGGRRAVTYTSDLRPESLQAFCRETVELAGLAEPDAAAEPPSVSLLAKDVIELELYDEAVARVSAAWALAQAVEAEKAALGSDARLTNSEGATWSRVTGATAFATSGGFVGGYRGTYASLVVEPLCDDQGPDGTPKKRNGHWWTGSRYLSKLESAEAVGKEAARRTLATLGSRKVETQECPIIFDPEVARGLISTVFSITNGSALWRKSTYLVGREGTLIASSLVSIYDDPLIPRAPGSRPFDGDGLPTRRNVVVDQGRFATSLCDVYSARKLGRESTGSASRGVGGNPAPASTNFVLEAGKTPAAELVRTTKRGLYVTNLMGFGFNAVTGDFSRGAAGFWIEGGELTFPVSEVTIAANFDDILKRIDAVGDDLVFRSSTSSPSFRVSHMMVAGTSAE